MGGREKVVWFDHSLKLLAGGVILNKRILLSTVISRLINRRTFIR
jgi:hypothetical protein